jgi:putative ABC transport system permease protein
VGVALLYLGVSAAQPLIETRFGLHVPVDFLSLREWTILGGVIGAGTVAGVLPAFLAYRNSVVDGMNIRT